MRNIEVKTKIQVKEEDYQKILNDLKYRSIRFDNNYNEEISVIFCKTNIMVGGEISEVKNEN